MDKDSYPKLLLALFAAFWLFTAISPHSRFDWMLENILVVIVVPLMVWTYKNYRFSNTSYTFVFLFLVLHMIGAYFTYPGVPIDWESWGFQRNHYDRVVHFMNGLLMYYPIMELVGRITPLGKPAKHIASFTIIVAAAGLFEIMEWLMAVIFSPEAVEDYLGWQGDEHDTVKDIAMATIGAAIAMVVSLVSDRKCGRESG